MPATQVTDLLFSASARWAGKVGSGGVASDVSDTIPLSSAANLNNGEAYVFVINRVSSAGEKNTLSEMETAIGELSGTNFINCVRGEEGVAQAWEADTVVEILFTATHWSKLVEAWETEHNQDGTHSVANMITEGTVKDEDDMASNSATALATQQSIKAYVDTDGGSLGGWTAVTDTWVYASASTFTIAGVDRTAIYTKGTRLKFTQTTVKYAVVVSSSFSTDTTVTIAVNTDYTIANAAITLPYYSYAANPQGYPHWFNWTPTYGGFSSAPTATHRFSVVGNLCSVQVLATANGASNATNYTLSAPIASAEIVAALASGYGADNNSALANPIRVVFASGALTVFTLYPTWQAGSSWTASSNKSASFSCSYRI